jgi:hypothetical protein
MYAEVSVIVDGALEEAETFHDYLLLEEYVRTIESDAADHGYPTEVYVVAHDHSPDVDECGCVQYLQDHKPQYAYNATESV